MNKHPLHIDLSQPLLDVVTQAGFEREQLFSMPELQAVLSTDEQGVKNTNTIEWIEAACKLTNDPSIALRFGQQLQIASFGTLGFALMSCASIRDVLKLMVRYHPVIGFGPSWILC